MWTSINLPFLMFHIRRSKLPAFRAIALGVLVLGACTSDAPEPDGNSLGAGTSPSTVDARPSSTELEVVEASQEIDVPFAMGKLLYGVPKESPTKLEAVVHAPFSLLAPAAFFGDNEQRFLAYHSIKKGRPTLAIHDLHSGDERDLARGAFSLAWRGSGRLAYFKGLKPRVRNLQRYIGHVVVQDSIRGRPQRWSRKPDRYTVTAWARASLLVHRLGKVWPDLLVFEGPRRVRVLAEQAALIALSPDGERALVTHRPSPSPAVSVVNVADGRVLARLDLAQVPGGVAADVGYVADSGSWTDDEAVTAVSGGLGIFKISAEAVALEEVLALQDDAFPTGFTQPRLDPTGRYITAQAEWVPRPRMAVSRNAIVECDRATGRCAVGRFATAPYSPHVLYNPSRP